MPFPPPPPPPGPPHPPCFTPAAPDGRGMLLQSIRQGTSLKKTVTNDKSAPAIAGRVQGAIESEGVAVRGGGSRGGAPLNGSATLGRTNGLGGLFANGMPKLKPTGLDIGQTQNSQSLTSLPSATGSGNHEQTRRQFNVDIKNRGPPPKPPPANQKPSMPQSTSDSVLTGSGPLHNRSSSTTSLAQGPRSHKAPPGGHGKPNVAPKPPGIKPPGRPTRAQSMRVPRSPPVVPPTGQSPLLPNQSELHRGAFYQSQDSLLHTPPPPKHNTLPSPRGAPTRPPLRPPQTRPPPPPPNKLVMTPPPPPSAPPPPPPHKMASPAPPPPPARNSSMRNGMTPSFSSKLEARFAERFHLREDFPPPQPFLGVVKVYNSRTAKQPAPQPPQHVQLVWSRDQQDNSSTC